MLKRYYFTFGTSPEFPFCGGWVIVVAPSIKAAGRIFKEFYPNEDDPRFAELSGNFGAFCHEIIEPRKPGESK